jgi:hypothetical protein
MTGSIWIREKRKREKKERKEREKRKREKRTGVDGLPPEVLCPPDLFHT